MKFIFADSLDYVDPGYDFIEDRMSEGRKPYWDDQFPHEILANAPYDGILVSRGIVGDHRFAGKYSESQSMRFRRVGARKFLRFFGNGHDEKPLYGDCGAFSYCKNEVPPYSSREMIEYYEDGGFTHGCSVDHIIFDFDRSLKGKEGGSEDACHRFEITLENAAEFIRESKALGPSFTPLGVVQGWSPGSMAEAARQLVAMGYDYLALGGMVPLNAASIHECLKAIKEKVPNSVKLHILGFAKAEQINEFRGYNIASFDSTSPLLRAFKDSTRNYYTMKNGGGLEYYTAIRIPQATENGTLNRLVKAGAFQQEELVKAEKRALSQIRAYDADLSTLEEALDAILTYARYLHHEPNGSPNSIDRAMERLQSSYRRTLLARPWKSCPCRVCEMSGIEVMLFRSSNRNKRRGIHNLAVFYQHLKTNEGVTIYEQ